MINTVQRLARSPALTMAAGAMVSVGVSALACLYLQTVPEGASLASIRAMLARDEAAELYDRAERSNGLLPGSDASLLIATRPGAGGPSTPTPWSAGPG
jgi:hypothetical protein